MAFTSSDIGIAIAGVGVVVFLVLWFLGKASLNPGTDAVLKLISVFVGGGLAYGAMAAFDGAIDEVWIFNGALGASDVGRLHDGSFAVASASNVLYDDAYLVTTTYDANSRVRALHWDMETLLQGKMEDLSGNGNHGTVTGTTPVAGQYGQARSFNGNGATILVDSPKGLSRGRVTVAAWVRVAAHKDWIDYVSHGWCAAGAWNLASNAAGRAVFSVAGASCGDQANAISTAVIPLNTWTHLVGTYDGSVARIYVNGGPPVNVTAAGKILSPGFSIRAMATDDAGQLDEIYVFDRALFPDEVARLYEGSEEGRYEKTYYDGLGRPGVRIARTFFGTLASMEEYVYGFRDRVERYIDPMGKPYSYEYDFLGRILLVITPDGRQETSYNDTSRSVVRFDEVGRRSAVWYDVRGRPSQVGEWDPSRLRYNFTNLSYDLAGNLVKVVDPAGKVTLHDYGFLGRLSRTTYPDGNGTYESFEYDDAGKLVTKTKRDSTAIAYGYWEDGSLKQIVYPGAGGTADYAYDRNGNLKKLTYGGTTLWYEYDDQGRMTKESTAIPADGTNLTLEYGYDPGGNLVSMRYPDGVDVSYDLDDFDRVSILRIGSTAYAGFGYRDDGRIDTLTFGNGFVTTYDYDQRGRPYIVITSGARALTTTLRPNGNGDTIQWSKSGTGGYNYQRVNESSSDGNATFVYAKQGGKVDKYQVQDVTLAQGEVIRSVEVHAVAMRSATSTNASLRLRVNNYENTAVYYLSTSYADLSASWAKNPATGNDWTGAEVNALQAGIKLNAITKGEARVTQVYVLVRTSRDVTPLRLDYDHNDASDRTSLGITDELGSISESYAYDGQDRLTRFAASGRYALTQTFGYDAVGNRLAMNDNGTSWTYAYNEDNRVWKYNRTGFVYNLYYDRNGNLDHRTPSSGTIRYFTYDAEDRLTQVKGGAAVVATYTYDGLGRRVKAVEGATTTYFAFTGITPVYTKQGTTITKYLYAAGLLVATLSGATTSYVLQDELGSVRLVMDPSGNVLFRTSYKPFGGQYAASGTDPRLKFTGQWNEASTGLYYLGARHYDPETGRFLQQDPVLGSLGQPQTLNRYPYVRNNPTRYVDPTGLIKGCPSEIDQRACNYDLLRAEWGGSSFPPDPAWMFLRGLVIGTVFGVFLAIDWYLHADEGERGAFWTGVATGFAIGLAVGLSCVFLACAGLFLVAMAGLGTTAASLGAGIAYLAAGGRSEGGLGATMLWGGVAAGMGFGAGYTIGGVPTKVRTVVIGEDMGRVKGFASRYGYEVMPDLPPGNRMAANRAWINARMDEGYTIVDIGPAPGREFYPSLTSKYYIMEHNEIFTRNYPRYLPLWGVVG